LNQELELGDGRHGQDKIRRRHHRPVGHTLAAVTKVLGGVREVSARLVRRRNAARVEGTGEIRPITAHDQVLVAGVLDSGAPLSLHYRGGLSRGAGLLWEINGTEGDIQVSSANGHVQMVQLSLAGGRGDAAGVQPLPVPAAYLAGLAADVLARNVACVYGRMAADLRDGTRTAPGFDDAVRLHRVVAAIERAAEEGCAVSPQA